MYFVMNALFNRRIYKHFGLIRDRLVTARRHHAVRTLKTVPRNCHATLCRPLSGLCHECAACSVYCTARRRLSDDVHSHKHRFESAADGRWSNRCNCCGLNSKGAQELATFLTDELKLEKQFTWKQLPELHGFQLSSTSGPAVVLTKRFYNEIVRIRFNVINSLFEDIFAQFENTEGGQEDTDDDASPHLVSRPAFDVELERDGDKFLVIHCVFQPPTDLPMSFDTLHDTFYIDGVAMKPNPCHDSTYYMSKASISSRLRKQLLAMLERRGVGPMFAQQLVELSTAYEHYCYVNFLQQLRDFARSVPAVT